MQIFHFAAKQQCANLGPVLMFPHEAQDWLWPIFDGSRSDLSIQPDAAVRVIAVVWCEREKKRQQQVLCDGGW